jgi:spermidine synthase
MLAVSGMSALVYQVCWLRTLGQVLGARADAVALTLAIFMLGISLGSLTGGYWSRRVSRPLRAFGFVEVSVGVFALASVVAMPMAVDYLSVLQVSQLGDNGPLTSIMAATLVLLPPTFLMGVSFPLVVRSLSGSSTQVTQQATRLYSANILGAILGAALSGFILIPQFGVATTVLTAAVMSVAIGVLAVTRFFHSPAPLPQHSDANLPVDSATVSSREPLTHLGMIGLAFFSCGAIGFALETLWTRWLILLMGVNSTYAFTAILLAFLIGSYIGSRRGADWFSATSEPINAFAVTMTLLAALIAFIALLVSGLPFIKQYLPETLQLRLALAVAATLLVVPLAFLSATCFTFAAKAAALRSHGFSYSLGILYGLNTIGCVVGALSAGFIVLPALGLQSSMSVIAIAALLLGALLFAARRSSKKGFTISSVAFVSIALCIIGIKSLPAPILFNQHVQGKNLVFYREAPETSVAVVETPSGERELIVGGDFQSGSDPRHLVHLRFLGHLPALFALNQQQGLVVGLGAGFTLTSLLRHPLSKVDLVEITEAMPEAADTFAQWTGAPLRNDRRVHLHIEDGRRFLATSLQKWDIITTDPIDPTDAGASNLYSVEYYRLVKEHLREGGVAAQWLTSDFAVNDYRGFVESFRQVFPCSFLFRAEYTTVIIGFADGPQISSQEIEKRIAALGAHAELASLGINSFDSLKSFLLLDSDNLKSFSMGGRLITDNHPWIEFATSPPTPGIFDYLGRYKQQENVLPVFHK